MGIVCAPNRYPDDIISDEHDLVRQRRVALLVDYPILMRAVRAAEADAAPRLRDIVLRARELGAVTTSRAYGAWYDIDEATSAFTDGLDPVFVPPAAPGMVPTTSRLVSDGLALLERGQTDVLAVSGDDRVLPLLEAAHAAGIPIALIAHACADDGPCLALADVSEPASAYTRQLTRTERYRRPKPAA